jgi:hypothetical protein
MVASASGVGLACWRRAIAVPMLAWGLLNVGRPASSNSRRRSRAQRGTARCYSSACRWACLTLLWSPSHRDVVVRSQTPPRPDEGWSPGHWGRRGFELLETRHRPETWELAWYRE